jgi:hypothetical protein
MPKANVDNASWKAKRQILTPPRTWVQGGGSNAIRGADQGRVGTYAEQTDSVRGKGHSLGAEIKRLGSRGCRRLCAVDCI